MTRKEIFFSTSDKKAHKLSNISEHNAIYLLFSHTPAFLSKSTEVVPFPLCKVWFKLLSKSSDFTNSMSRIVLIVFRIFPKLYHLFWIFEINRERWNIFFFFQKIFFKLHLNWFVSLLSSRFMLIKILALDYFESLLH